MAPLIYFLLFPISNLSGESHKDGNDSGDSSGDDSDFGDLEMGKENTIIEKGCIFAGVPAKKVKMVSEALISGEINRIADNYVMYSGWFK